MSRPALPFVWLADVLRAAGLEVVEFPGWQTRAAKTAAKATWGVLCHHDAAPPDNVPPTRAQRTPPMIAHGHSQLPGPISQLCITDDARVHVIAAGVANHAGRGRIPNTAYVDGNARLIGIEVNNSGVGEQWSAAVLNAYLTTCAAVLNHLGLGSERCIAHKEYAPRRKIDPGGPWDPAFQGPGLSWDQMGRWRNLVADRMRELSEPPPVVDPTRRSDVVFLAKQVGTEQVWLVDGNKRHALSAAAVSVYQRRPEVDPVPMVLTPEEMNAFTVTV